MARPKPLTIATGKHLALRSQQGWEYAERVNGSGVVAIIAITAQQELILTEQFRPPIQKRVLDLAAGLSGDIAGAEEESLLTAAMRELSEETGYESSDWSFAFAGPTSPGMSTETVSFFIARNCQKTSTGGGDESEDIVVHTVPLTKISAWLKRKTTKSRCIDLKVYAAVGVLSQREV